MPNSEARIPTGRAGRYLTQLGRHADAIGHRAGHPGHDTAEPGRPRLRAVELSESAAVLRFDQGRCTLEAAPDALVVRVETDDAASLRRIEQLIGADLERFGHRDGLLVDWHRAATGADAVRDAAVRNTVTGDDAVGADAAGDEVAGDDDDPVHPTTT
jgi:hypothetical protein